MDDLRKWLLLSVMFVFGGLTALGGAWAGFEGAARKAAAQDNDKECHLVCYPPRAPATPENQGAAH